jgi:hypothetical protein
VDKFFIDKEGKADWCTTPCTKKRNVRFPLCLAIKYRDDVPFLCADFLLNSNQRRVFVKTDAPLPEGSPVTLHFYIPPDKKLLGEFQGRVMKEQGLPPAVRGNFIKIHDFLHRKLDKLEEYLEEKRHLVDGTW